jgi:tRNA-Thr(GGU) m(6)t(6)A37 methyltransferase TsaA
VDASLRVIGHLRSCLREKFAAPRQPLLAPGATATLTLKAEFLPEHSLAGLAGFTHVWLFSYFHLNTNKKFLPKVRPPRLKGAAIGLFASRSPHRPSPLGLSLARLERVEGATLHLAGVDLVDGTPILDVKPYIPEWDSVPHAGAGWVKDAPFPTLKVVLSKKALSDVAAAEKRLKRTRLAALLKDLLTQDPRNPRDKAQNEEGLELGFFLHDFEARFAVKRGTATVLRLLTGTTMHKKTPVAPPRRIGLRT